MNAVTRKFIFKGKDLGDPDPTASPEAVMDILSSTKPELVNALVEGPEANEDGSEITYTFKERVGKHG